MVRILVVYLDSISMGCIKRQLVTKTMIVQSHCNVIKIRSPCLLPICYRLFCSRNAIRSPRGDYKTTDRK